MLYFNEAAAENGGEKKGRKKQVSKSFVERLAKQFGINTSNPEDYIEEEIISMVNEGHEQGVFKANEAEMIQNIFEFTDKEAQDVMTHRRNIIAVDGNTRLQDAMDFMLDERHSRFPVYEEEIDNITGILFLKDAMRCLVKKQYGDWRVKDIPGLIRPAIFIPETRNISSLFKSMQSKKLQMVIVADEYGQTAGLVAMEDILEEIVGNIQDEYDNEETMIEKQEDGDFLISGLAPLDDVAEALGITFEEEEFETLNGYLVSKLDKIPSEDERSQISAYGYGFQILSVANKIIEKVKVHKLPDEAKSEEEKE